MQMIILIHPFPAIYVGSGSGGGSLSRDLDLDLPIPSHFLQLIQRDTKSSSFVFLGMH